MNDIRQYNYGIGVRKSLIYHANSGCKPTSSLNMSAAPVCHRR